MQIVNKNKLVRYIKKSYGNFYTVQQILKQIEERGAESFKELDIRYLGFNEWEIR